MSLLLPDHDTKRDCVFKIGGRDPNASGARAPRHSDPLQLVPGGGSCFRRGPGGSFRLDERRPPLHSHGGGIATMRWPADAHLEVRRRLVNSLLERLRRRLRELGRPLHEGLPSDGRRHSSHAPADDASPRRTEIELSHPSRSADRTGSGEQARLPAQQPPPPTSTRLKAAVFSKKRPPAPRRQSGTIWGPTSFLDVGTRAEGDDKTDRSSLMLFEAGPVASGATATSELMSWPTQPPPAAADSFGTGADVAHPLWWTPEQRQTQAKLVDSFEPPLGGSTPLDGALALGQNSENSRRVPETLQLDLDFGSAPPALANWRDE